MIIMFYFFIINFYVGLFLYQKLSKNYSYRKLEAIIDFL